MEYDLGVSLSAPTVSLTCVANATGGSLSAGNYTYAYTFVSVNGETKPSSGTVVAVVASGSVNLTVPIGNALQVIGRRIYRTAAGGSSLTLVYYISDNITTSYLDIASDASIAANAAVPVVNTALSIDGFNGILRAKDTIAHTVTNGIVASLSQTQAGGVLLTTSVNIVGTATVAGNSVTLPPTRVVGEVYVVRNNGAYAISVFPNVGQSINSNSANVAYSVPVATTVNFIAFAMGSWQTY